jgi:RimJ/RimL family protein N-acetyltransferase
MTERATLQRPGALRLRPATPADMEQIFEWRNDPDIVSRSSSGRTVTREEHCRWFSRAIADPATLFYVIELDGVPAGQARFERRASANEAVISVYLLAAHAGKGHGRIAIRTACGEAIRKWQVERVIAHVRQDNSAAMRAFTASGFAQGADAGAPAGHATYVFHA